MTKKKPLNSKEKQGQKIIIQNIEAALTALHNHFVSNSVASNGNVSTTFIKASFDTYIKHLKKGAGIKETNKQ